MRYILMVKNKRKIVLILIICLLLVLLTLTILNTAIGNNVLYNMYNTITGRALSDTTELSYVVYDNQDENRVKTLVTIANDNGIEYVIKPDETKVNVNGKKKLALDTVSALDDEITFKVKIINSADVEEKKMKVTQQYIDDKFTLTDISTNDDYTIFNVACDLKMADTDKTYCRIGNNSDNWLEYENTIKCNWLDIENKESNTVHTGISTIQFKKADKSGNIVYAKKQCQITSKNAEIYGNREKLGVDLNYYGITTYSSKTNEYYDGVKFINGSVSGSRLELWILYYTNAEFRYWYNRKNLYKIFYSEYVRT